MATTIICDNRDSTAEIDAMLNDHFSHFLSSWKLEGEMSEDPEKYEPLGVDPKFGQDSDPNWLRSKRAERRSDSFGNVVPEPSEWFAGTGPVIQSERTLQIRIEALRAAALVYSGMCANPNVTPGNSEMEAAHVLDWSEQFAAWLEGK